jgi:hypothetical protein
VRVGIPNSSERVVDLPCEVIWELDYSGCIVCGPFVDRGAKGEKSTSRIGWEVPVRSHRLASGSKEESLAIEEHQQSIRRLLYLCFKLPL